MAEVKVWDWPVRGSHWVLAVCVAGSWWSGEQGATAFVWHQVCGYTALVTVVFRLGWGVFGTRTARFSDFLVGPRAVAEHLRALWRRELPPHAGHAPSGGWAALALWLAVLAQAGTGLFANDDIFNAGPFYGWVEDGLSDSLTTWHHFIFDGLLVLVGLHVVAIVFYRLWGGQHLLQAMFTGRRNDLPAAAAIGPERLGWAVAWWLVVAGTLALAVWLAPPAVVLSC